MAVAPVPVEMGPRNKRRLTTTAITLVSTTAVVTFALWAFGGGVPFTHSTNQSAQPAKPSVIVLIPQRPGFAFGMTRQQILHRLGPPERIAGQCWQYSENIKDFAGGTINAVRMCFWANRYQSWFMERNGKWQNVISGRGGTIPPPTRP